MLQCRLLTVIQPKADPPRAENYMETSTSEKNMKLSTPVAIIIAGVIIAVAVLIPKTTVAPVNTDGSAKQEVKIKPIDRNEHILGNANAKIVIVEFSDTECPFCKIFYPTMQKVVTDYQGKVAWVYRHFPLDSLHSKARKEAEATECAAELGGNDGFWKYLDRIYEITPGNNGLDPVQLYNIADYAGLDKAKFTACLTSGKYAPKVEAQSQDGIAAGVQGTPSSFILKDGKIVDTIQGANSYENIKVSLDKLLK